MLFRAPDDLGPVVAAALAVLEDAGVLVIPTETFYGLGADPRRADAVARIFALKGRPGSLALPVLCASWDQVDALTRVPSQWRERLDRLWPGPLTAVLPASSPLPATRRGTLAVRIPGHPLLLALLELVGPLTGTSANRHGRPPCCELEAAVSSLLGVADLALDGGSTSGGAPSTVVDLSGPEARVLRQGLSRWL